MQRLFLSLVYLMFFLSGAAALIYEVVWVRSLTLVFGGTHLAVTTVLSVYMGGLALGSYTIGKRAHRLKKPLQFYGVLEFGIALAAMGFLLLMEVYPTIYAALVTGGESPQRYLTMVRVLFAFLALIVPTTLMGGTLPVLTRFVSGYPHELGTRLALLYGFNTLGAVAGTAAAGFFLLRHCSVSGTFYTAMAINVAIGLGSLLLQGRVAALLADTEIGGPAAAPTPTDTAPQTPPAREDDPHLALRVALWGIGVSGFCALGYEVLWTRILTLTIGTSVYGFCIMLVAFLTGIALGSNAYGLLRALLPAPRAEIPSLLRWFGSVQCAIGLSALLVSLFLRDLPANSIRLSGAFQDLGLPLFHARQWANLTLAFCYMIVPTFFMGLAFPIAGKVSLSSRRRLGHAVGTVLAYNTVGAILGSAVSGFFLIYVFGIERSLQLLSVVNVGCGLLVVASIRRAPLLKLAVTAASLATLTLLMVAPDSFRMWNTKYFAIFQNNQPDTYSTPEKIQDALDNTEILFYYEGIDSTISAIRVKGGIQAVLVNGKVVASDALRDRQCQMTLGHLPMLLHPNPQRVLVVGLGTGMTLGATSVHPEVTDLTLAEIEPHVTGAARTFARYNHQVLDDPKLKIVFNDGRNFLMTTTHKYDVITADPIHPWTQGSGYLYTAEYFKLAADHLLPGGVMCQWLPIYELSVDDLKSVVKTFSENFRYTLAWMTQYDAEIIGSNAPLVVDEEALERRIALPAVASDLAPVMMASAEEFLSYFLMGTEGMAAFGRGAVTNTDDNLYLEFSTPISLGKNLTGVNVAALAQHRESIQPYLVPAGDDAARLARQQTWDANERAAALADRAHALFLAGRLNDPEFRQLVGRLEQEHPRFSPGRFLWEEYRRRTLKIPTLLDKLPLALADEGGHQTLVEVSAVVARVSDVRAAVVFVDNATRTIFGQVYFSGTDLESRIAEFTREVLAEVQEIYSAEARRAQQAGLTLPKAAPTLSRIEEAIQAKCEAGES